MKAIAGLGFNLGGALLGAVSVRLFYAPAIDGVVILWSITLAGLFWLSYMLLGLLEPEIEE